MFLYGIKSRKNWEGVFRTSRGYILIDSSYDHGIYKALFTDSRDILQSGSYRHRIPSLKRAEVK